MVVCWVIVKIVVVGAANVYSRAPLVGAGSVKNTLLGDSRVGCTCTMLLYFYPVGVLVPCYCTYPCLNIVAEVDIVF